MSELTLRPRIVVGFSHSAASAAALLWALREATIREAAVEPVHAWQWSGEYRASYAPMDTWSGRDEEHDAVTDRTRRAISLLAPQLSPIVLHGPTVQVLLKHAEGAELLVLGGRRADPDTPGPPGPVVHACLAGAPCPVVVVPAWSVPSRRREARGTTDVMISTGVPFRTP
ncbi:universal stress protein [Thermostaphylospora chromogena]|uniref:universal stress protein n=1 Tax=Thermostaphylospora chromogena TaxID=35622 RepID=UPI0013F5C827|nr:universal stress protein [Thermostaphylospora chromogena]